MTRIVKSLRSGQLTIPADFREQLGIDTDTLLQINLINGELRIKPVKTTQTVAGSPWIKELYKLFAPIRKDASKYTDAQINTTIDRAVKAVRRKRHG
ncbi:AbrB/MazE/SpoVT family DNA-binding domain-containing protein [Candidatus Microgenomates bacterium]|nr:AbrB/MazE/SpoVT family DNA-binding domain-containing protein [Candidatus Microgenomates bacterium]